MSVQNYQHNFWQKIELGLNIAIIWYTLTIALMQHVMKHMEGNQTDELMSR